MAKPFLYRCLRTGQTAQGLVDGEPPEDGSKQYEAVEGLACRGFHFVNVATLKLLYDEIED
jgi:hypothetical protein